MACANADFIFCANHTVRFHTTKLALLDDKLLVSIIEFCAESGNNHFLTSCNVWCSTHDLLHMSFAFIHGAHMHVVTIGMRLTSEYLTYYQSFESTLDGLHFFNCVNFQTHAGEGICHFLRCHIEVNVFF